MAPRYPSIPEPTLEATSLRDSILAIKQMLEILTGQRGNAAYAAVMPGDLTEAVTDIDASIDAVNALAASKVDKDGDTMSGPLLVPVKGSHFGNATGTVATGAVSLADANIVLYNNGVNNWAGIGTDSNGNIWFKVGVSGTPVPAMYFGSSGQIAIFANPPTAPTPAESDVTTKLATTAWVGSAWSTFTPTVTIAGGGAGTVNSARYKRLGKTVALSYDVSVTTGGTSLTLTYPAGVAPAVAGLYLVGREVAVNGLTWVGQCGAGVLLVRANDAATAVTAGHRYQISGVMESS